MELSVLAKNDLRETLIKEFGAEKVANFSDEEINTIGVLLLNILAEHLKMKVADPELITEKL